VPFETIAILGQNMDENFKNETEFFSKHLWIREGMLAQPVRFGSIPRKHLGGWRKLHYLSDFVITILGLSGEERAVLDAVRGFQMPKTAAKLAKTSGVNRKQTNRILKQFESRQLVRKFLQPGKRDRWSYNRKLSRL
jgi:hypothetical protein